MSYIYTNNAAGTLGANIGPSDTLVLLGVGQGVLFPSPAPGDYFYATIVHLTTGAVEVVQVTSRSADTLTVVRGRDNTNAVAFTTGSVIEVRANAQMFREMDWRNFTNQANGVLQLDAGGLIPDARIPTSIARTAAMAATYIPLAQRGAVNGVPTLDGAALIPANQIPVLPYISTSGGSATGTIISGLNSGQFRVGGQGAGQSSMVLSFNGQVAFATAGVPGTFFTLFHSGNFNPNDKLNVSGGTITGTLTSVGTITAQDAISVRRSGAANQGLIYFGSSGSDFILMNATDWTFGGGKVVYAADFISTSDARAKNLAGYKPPRLGISRQLSIAEWTMKESGDFGRGPVAQDVLRYAPQHVLNREGVLHVNKTSLALDLIYDLSNRLSILEDAPCSLSNKSKLLSHFSAAPTSRVRKFLRSLISRTR